MKKKIIFTVSFVILLILIAFGLFKIFKNDNNTDTNLKKVKVAEPTLTWWTYNLKNYKYDL